jgi:hypothetical protein
VQSVGKVGGGHGEEESSLESGRSFSGSGGR